MLQLIIIFVMMARLLRLGGSMLILTRKPGERIIINDNEVVISVLEINRNQAKIGIKAPEHIKVHREEVFDRIKKGEENDQQYNV
tara:strand:- start:187 stop:441 length:255 start_codon:yes stop_codon:yes gene_type:complete